MLNEQRVLVTGGASGIGRATARELCREGAAVLIVDKSAAGQTVVDELAGAGHAALFYQGDVADGQAGLEALAQARLASPPSPKASR